MLLLPEASTVRVLDIRVNTEIVVRQLLANTAVIMASRYILFIFVEGESVCLMSYVLCLHCNRPAYSSFLQVAMFLSREMVVQDAHFYFLTAVHIMSFLLAGFLAKGNKRVSESVYLCHKTVFSTGKKNRVRQLSVLSNKEMLYSNLSHVGFERIPMQIFNMFSRPGFKGH